MTTILATYENNKSQKLFFSNIGFILVETFIWFIKQIEKQSGIRSRNSLKTIKILKISEKFETKLKTLDGKQYLIKVSDISLDRSLDRVHNWRMRKKWRKKNEFGDWARRVLEQKSTRVCT